MTRTPWSPALRRRNARLRAERVAVARQLAAHDELLARARRASAERAREEAEILAAEFSVACRDPHERAGCRPVSLEPPYRMED